MNLCVVQARLASTRFPNKVLAGLVGRPMLAHVVERAQAIPGIDQVVLSLPTHGKEEEALVWWAEQWGIAAYRDQEPLTATTNDVLGGFLKTARELKADVVVRVTGDCPLLDPWLAGDVLERVVSGRVNFSSNCQPERTFPDGLDVEAFTLDVLQRAAESSDPHDREHVTSQMPTFFAGQLGAVCLMHVEDLSAIRWTVDTPEDLPKARRILSHLPLIPPPALPPFGMLDTITAAKAAGVWP